MGEIDYNGFLATNHGASSNLVRAWKKPHLVVRDQYIFLLGKWLLNWLAQRVRFQANHPQTKSLTKMSEKWPQAREMWELITQRTSWNSRVFFSSPDGKQPGTQNKDFGTVWMMELTRSLVLSAVQGIRLLGAQNHSARTWVLCDHPFCTWQAKKIWKQAFIYSYLLATFAVYRLKPHSHQQNMIV